MMECQRCGRNLLTEEYAALEDAVWKALRELDVPTEDYPAPVANAIEILTEALSPQLNPMGC